jgi:histidinol-phosphatase
VPDASTKLYSHSNDEIMNKYSDRLKLALEMAVEASELILKYYQVGALVVESKLDDSPVTVADRGAEQLMRARISAAFPDDAILGEEFPDQAGQSGYRWILDPIDGTKAFIHGVPLFGCLIGIEHQERMVAGVCRFPALNEVVYAAEGEGAWWKIADNAAVRVTVSRESDLSRARLIFTEPTSWIPVERYDILFDLMKKVRIARGWGDCYGHAMVATGRAEIAIDPLMSPWDIAALIPILREAGGVCVDWRGEESINGGDGISLNAELRQQVLILLKDIPPLKPKQIPS